MQREYLVANERPSHILSEGEQKAVALADFFTEVKLANYSGVIFDDPVNSLDIHRREKVATRLVEESKKRQVIVLTHDLLFLNDLNNKVGELGVASKRHWIEKNDNDNVGVITTNCLPDLISSFIKPEGAKKKLSCARKETNPNKKISLLREGYSLLRKSYEAFIIKRVFKSAISPYDRRIKQAALAEVDIPKGFLQEISKEMGSISEEISGHIQVDQSAASLISEKLEGAIKKYEKYEKYVRDLKGIKKVRTDNIREKD